MKATGALPTEDRVQRMNDQQWLWYYLNLLEDEKEEELKWKTRLDYMGWWVNPKLAKSVMEQELNSKAAKNKKQAGQPTQIGGTEEDLDPTTLNDGDQILVQGEEVVSDSFEEELRKALGDAGAGEELTSLPDSESVGDPTMSQEDFISKVMFMQDTVATMPNIEATPSLEDISQFDGNDDFPNTPTEFNYDSEDIDFFEYPDEG